MIEDGGPAFPQIVTEYDQGACEHTRNVHSVGGMFLREYAAIRLRSPESGVEWLDEMIRKAKRDECAMIAVASYINADINLGPERAACWAYELADAMIAESAALPGEDS